MVGIILLGNILKYVFYAYPVQTKFMFIGLIIGSVPELFKKANSKKGFKLSYLIYFIFSFSVGVLLVLLEKKLNFSENNISQFSFAYLLISGFFMSAGVIIPGVSSTLILILLPLGIGLIIGSFICMKLIKSLLDNYYSQTFYCIIGFTLGSIFVLYPGISCLNDAILGALGLLLGLSIIMLPLGDNS